METASDRTRSMTADADLPRRLARSYLRWQLSRGWWIALFVLAAVLVLAALAVTILSRGATLLLLTGLWLVLIAAIPLSSYLLTLRSARRGYPAGSTIEARVGDDTLYLASALGTSEVRYAALRSVDERRDALIVRLTSAAGAALLIPSALFTEDDVARLRAAAG